MDYKEISDHWIEETLADGTTVKFKPYIDNKGMEGIRWVIHDQSGDLAVLDAQNSVLRLKNGRKVRTLSDNQASSRIHLPRWLSDKLSKEFRKLKLDEDEEEKRDQADLSPSERARAVMSAFTGQPDEILEDLAGELKEILDEEQKERLEGAWKDIIRIYPEDRNNAYIIRSYGLDEDPPDESEGKYNVFLIHEPSCTCPDFHYRGDGEDGPVCKHIWKLRLLLKTDVLPEGPFNHKEWIVSELKKDLDYVESSENKSKIQELLSDIEEQASAAINLERICKKRGRIMSESLEEEDDDSEDMLFS